MEKVKIGTYISWLNKQGVSCKFGTGKSPGGATYELFRLEKDGFEYVLTGQNQFETMHPHTVLTCDRLFGLNSPWGEGY